MNCGCQLTGITAICLTTYLWEIMYYTNIHTHSRGDNENENP